jgi:hypothetical protein
MTDAEQDGSANAGWPSQLAVESRESVMADLFR